MVYGEQLTEDDYRVFLDNRIPSIASITAHEENSDLKVSSLNWKWKMQRRKANAMRLLYRAKLKRMLPKYLLSKEISR